MDTKFYKIIKPLIRILFKGIYRPKVIGLDNISATGSLVLAGNHTKWLDPIMLVSVVPRQIHFLAKDSLFKGITGPIVKGMGSIPVNRKTHDKNALEAAINCLKENSVVGVFPEGTINYTKETTTLPFKIGAVKMAKETKSDLVPFVITGNYKLFSSKIKIEFLPSRKITAELTLENEQLRQEISQKLEGKNECN